MTNELPLHLQVAIRRIAAVAHDTYRKFWPFKIRYFEIRKAVKEALRAELDIGLAPEDVERALAHITAATRGVEKQGGYFWDRARHVAAGVEDVLKDLLLERARRLKEQIDATSRGTATYSKPCAHELEDPAFAERQKKIDARRKEAGILETIASTHYRTFEGTELDRYERVVLAGTAVLARSREFEPAHLREALSEAQRLLARNCVNNPTLRDKAAYFANRFKAQLMKEVDAEQKVLDEDRAKAAAPVKAAAKTRRERIVERCNELHRLRTRGVWRDAYGVLRFIAEMETSHLQNILDGGFAEGMVKFDIEHELKLRGEL